VGYLKNCVMLYENGLDWGKVRNTMEKMGFVGCFLTGLGMMLGYQLIVGGGMHWSW